MRRCAAHGSVVAGALLAGIALISACGGSGERGGFAPDAGGPVDALEEELPPPPPQPAPVTPTADASVPPTDDCKRAAPSNACGVAPQCGCSPSETCDVIDAQGTAACVAFGKAPMGHPCTATPGCAKGLTCLFGTCHAFCGEPGKACAEPGTGACVQVAGQGGGAIPNLAACRVSCAPHDPSSCGGKTNAGVGVCFVDDEAGTDCQEGGTRLAGEACSPDDDCGPGLVCVKPGTGPDTCRRWCRVGTSDCGGATQCQSFATKVMVTTPAGSTEYGVCP